MITILSNSVDYKRGGVCFNSGPYLLDFLGSCHLAMKGEACPPLTRSMLDRYGEDISYASLGAKA